MGDPLEVKSGEGHIRLRGLRDEADWAVLARIRDEAARGPSATRMESLVSAPDRLRIAEAGHQPVGYLFVAGEAGPRLDEFGTIEGWSWLFYGPTCVPAWQGRGVERALLSWLAGYAREMGIPRLIRLERVGGQHPALSRILEEAGFREMLRYYQMRLEVTEAPPRPRALPDGLGLVDFRGEEDFPRLWSVLEPAFAYLERGRDAEERNRAIYGSMQAAYFPICIDEASGEAVGTVAAVPLGDRWQIATLGVIPARQGQGIGSSLMERAIEAAWRSGVKVLELSVRAENPQAIAIYRRLGFETVPERTIRVLQKDL